MIKVDIKQYMAMLSSFTECAQYRSECYRLEAENEKLRSPRNQVDYFDYGSRMGAN